MPFLTLRGEGGGAMIRRTVDNPRLTFLSFVLKLTV